MTICNSLALLVSQAGSSKDYAVRLALLTMLQKCWLNGHLIIKLECSYDGAINCISDPVLQDSNTDFTSELGIPSANDVISSLSSEHCDTNEHRAASSGVAVEPKCEFLNVSETAQDSVVATDGCELVFYICIDTNFLFHGRTSSPCF